MEPGFFVLMCIVFYLSAFVVIHRSSSLRQPAYNLAHWYYSDNDGFEAIEFYAFWPLRQVTYKFFPGFMSEHIIEQK